MTIFNNSRLFGFVSSIFLLIMFYGLAIANDTQELQQGTINVEGKVLNFEKEHHRLVVSDQDGQIVFQWKSEGKDSTLKDFDYNRKMNCFVVLSEIFDSKEKTYSLVCKSKSGVEIVRNHSTTPCVDAVYFELENGQQWIVYTSEDNILTYYKSADKRALGKIRFQNSSLHVSKAIIDAQKFLMLNRYEASGKTLKYKQLFAGENPHRNPILPLEPKHK